MNTDEDKSRVITITKDGATTNIYFKNTLNGENELLNVERKEKFEEYKCNKNVIAKYENSENRLELIMKQQAEIIDDFDKTINLDDKNSILINDLQEEKLKSVFNKVSYKIQEKVNTLLENTIKVDDFKKISGSLLNKDYIDIEDITVDGVTETEKNRFNSRFEIFKSENLDKEELEKVLESIKENIVGMKVQSNTVLKLEMSMNESNENTYNKIINFVKNSKNKKYNVNIEYDNDTGLVKYMVIEIAEESI